MSLVRKDSPNQLLDWPLFSWPERMRFLTNLTGDDGWMRVEEFREGDTMIVRAELPDIDPAKDVEVTVANGVVSIRAHREERAEHKEKKGYRSEFRYGEFERDMLLPEGTKAKDVMATYKDGILEVKVPMQVEPGDEVTKVAVTRG